VEDAEREVAVEALMTGSNALLAIAIRSVEAGPADLTVAQHRVLVLVDRISVLSINAVADHLGVDQSTASRHCTRLARLGLVTRTRATHDGRAVDVRLTPAGRRQVRAVREARRAEILRVLDRMSDRAVREALQGFAEFDAAAVGAAMLI
jgi:DNA-binding MarR family transcriptional regulator